MGKQRSRTRIVSSIDKLPDDVRSEVNSMLADKTITYISISEWLKSKGYDISKSAVGRYALRSNNAALKLEEAQKQTEALVNVIKKNPDADYTNAGLMLLMDGLIKKLATAEEEFDNMPLDKAGRLITAISRTKIYKDKVQQDMQKKIDLAFQGMEAEIMQIIKDTPSLAAEMKAILYKAKEKMVADD